jgi:hypothetical protein
MDGPAGDWSYALEEADRQGRLRQAVKAALATSLAMLAANVVHLESSYLAPLLAFVLMTLGAPEVVRNWLQTLAAVAVNAAATGFFVLVIAEPGPLFLLVMLLWLFGAFLFSSRWWLPAVLGTMVSAIALFMAVFDSTAATFAFLHDYTLNLLLGGFFASAVHVLIWPRNLHRLFLHKLAEVYARWEQDAIELANRLVGPAALPRPRRLAAWAPFRDLHRLLSPDLRRQPDTSNSFTEMIRLCQGATLRLEFLLHHLPRILVPAETEPLRRAILHLVQALAGHFRSLLASTLAQEPAPALDPAIRAAVRQLPAVPGNHAPLSFLLRHGNTYRTLELLVEGVADATEHHNIVIRVLAQRHRYAAIPHVAPAGRKAFLSTDSFKASTKLVVIVLLMLGEQLYLGFPGGSQVAFFGTFAANVGNLGRQTRTMIVGMLGLVVAMAYGLFAAFLIARAPFLLLLTAFFFLGHLVSAYVYRTWTRFGVAGLQAGLGLVYVLLAFPGPLWGSFEQIRTRAWGLIVAGLTATAVHALLWPSFPVHMLRAHLAAAMADLHRFLAGLFQMGARGKVAAGPKLSEAAAGGRELLEDARFLLGPDQGHPLYQDVLSQLVDIDYFTEHIPYLLGMMRDPSRMERFFRAFADHGRQQEQEIQAVVDRLRRPAAGAPEIPRPPSLLATSATLVREMEVAAGVPVSESSLLLAVAQCLDDISEAVRRVAALLDQIDGRVPAQSIGRTGTNG